MKIELKTLTRHEISKPQTAINLLCSLLAGLFVIGIIFIARGINPFNAFYKIFAGSFGRPYGLKETITKAIPLILIASGLVVAFRAKFWNIGANGQLLMGAAASTWVALSLGPHLPAVIVVPLMILTSIIAGGLWAFFPAILRIKLGINEVISTLMFNYIAAEIITWLIIGPWKGKTQHGYPYTDDFPDSAVFGLIPGSRIHYLTLIIALVLALVLFFLVYKSRFGYEVRVVGENQEAAKYAGINFFKISVVTMLISGAAAGLAGMGEVAGLHHHLADPNQISSGYGFTAIIVAWLARLNPLMAIISGLFFAGILVGGDALQISLGLPAASIQIFNGILLIFLIIGEYFLKNKIIIKRVK